jgi:hypothetical protein
MEADGPWVARTFEHLPFFRADDKRRKGFPSETRVQRRVRVVHDDKELVEKVGRNDLCPCGSGSRSVAAARAAFDGVNRHHYFWRVIIEPCPDGSRAGLIRMVMPGASR